MILFFVILTLLLTALLAVSIAFNVKHARIIIEVEDALSESLDVCDNAYAKMTDVLDIPVALNTPEVYDVIRQIRDVRDSVLYVSNVLAEPYGGIIEVTDDIES